LKSRCHRVDTWCLTLTLQDIERVHFEAYVVTDPASAAEEFIMSEDDFVKVKGGDEFVARWVAEERQDLAG
jgi:hypothetical protein